MREFPQLVDQPPLLGSKCRKMTPHSVCRWVIFDVPLRAKPPPAAYTRRLLFSSPSCAPVRRPCPRRKPISLCNKELEGFGPLAREHLNQEEIWPEHHSHWFPILIKPSVQKSHKSQTLRYLPTSFRQPPKAIRYAPAPIIAALALPIMLCRIAAEEAPSTTELRNSN